MFPLFVCEVVNILLGTLVLMLIQAGCQKKARVYRGLGAHLGGGSEHLSKC
jgi:hypothetical protein